MMPPRFFIAWDHDTLHLWCSECPGGEEVWCGSGNPTPFDEIDDAVEAHTFQHDEFGK